MQHVPIALMEIFVRNINLLCGVVFTAFFCGILCGFHFCVPGSVQAGEASSANESAPVVFTGEIVVGSTLPLTGMMDYYGLSAYLGAKTRVRMINEQGGINGKRLTVIWRDNKSDPEQAIRDANELIDKYGVQAIIGPLLSNATLAVSDLASEREVVFISPMSSADTSARDKGWIFRAVFSNSWEAEGIALFQVRNFGARSCAILYDPRFEFSVEMSNKFDRAFRAAGGKVVGVLSIIDFYGKKNYTTPLKKLAAYSPDFIFAPCYGIEGVELIHAARDAGISTRFAAPVTWDTELVYDASGRRLAGTAIISFLFEKNYRYRPFQEFYKAMENAGMDVPDAMAAAGYDGVTLLVEGLKNGESSEKIREGIRTVRRFPFATGRGTMLPDGRLKKPLVVRFVEERNGRMLPIFAERFDPE